MNIQRIDENDSEEVFTSSDEESTKDSFFDTSSESEEEPGVYTLADNYESVATDSWVPQDVLLTIVKYADTLTRHMLRMTCTVLKTAIGVSHGHLTPREYTQKLLIDAATAGHLGVYLLLSGSKPVRFTRGVFSFLHEYPADIIVETQSAEMVREWIKAEISLTEAASHVVYRMKRSDVFRVLVEEGQPIMRFVKGLIQTQGPPEFALALAGLKA